MPVALLPLFSTALLLRSAAPPGRPASVVAARARRHAQLQMAASIVVTEGSGSFYGSRTIFQTLYDFGDFSSITASSSDVADAKKMLLSRQARYSGLIDVLKFSDAPLAEALSGTSMWLLLNADESQVAEQAQLAKSAGVGRMFLHFTPDGPTAGAPSDPAALQAALEASGVEFTVLRTGSLAAEGAGGGIKLSGVDEITCEDVPREDIYRFVTEALTLPAAAGRIFSLCPSVDASQLTEMRLAGCTRREEVEALLEGKIVEKAEEEEEKELTEEEKAAKAKAEAEAEAAEAAESADEIAALFARAQKTGEEMKKKKIEAEKALAEKQAERAEKYALTEEGEDALKAKKKEEEKEEDAPPPPPPDDDDGDSK